MGSTVWSDKRKFTWILSILLLGAFVLTSAISYQVAHESLREQIADNALPLTSDNIYSEIQQDLLRPIFISSLMAHDTFVRDWTLNQEQQPEKLIRYLKEIQDKYDTVTSFFISEKTRNYYHSSGVLKQIEDTNPDDAWYFRVRSLPAHELYEVNIDPDSADKSRTVVYVNYKVFDFNGNFIGVTGVGLAVDKVKELVELYQQRYNRRVYFVDTEGKVTLHGAEYEGGQSLQGSQGLTKYATRILTSPSASLTYQRDGKTIYLNSRLVSEFKWYLIVEQYEVESEQKLMNTFWFNIMLSVAVTIIIIVIANMTLGRYQRRLELLASTDKLTGVANRQAFDSTYSQALQTCLANQQPLSLVLLDIDHFKAINDSHGHNIGDLVIQSISHTLMDVVAKQGLVCRWGGEEFLLLLPDYDLARANELAEQVRHKVAERTIRVNGHQVRVTVSVGVASYRHDEQRDQLLNRADTALYQAKELGRNQVVLSH
ncbi:diguanylate cyclase [Shewanella waksmanii]|uniref:sensor domain-containing diguanylate cyclase n=1 Tax=Shewanella waksmanii TaxID=213783 RepID=UPI003736E9A2